MTDLLFMLDVNYKRRKNYFWEFMTFFKLEWILWDNITELEIVEMILVMMKEESTRKCLDVPGWTGNEKQEVDSILIYK